MKLRLIAILLSVELVFPSYIFASDEPIVIVSVHDGNGDALSDELVEPFSESFIAHGFNVVEKDKVDAVLGYYNGADERSDIGAEDAIARAKEHYYNLDYSEGLAQIERAISLLEGRPELISEIGTTLRDAYVVAAIIAKSAKKDEDVPRSYFKKALSIDPDYSIDPKGFSPSIVELFNREKAEISKQPFGSIKVDTDPKVAEVYLNGMIKGVTPIFIDHLPEGHYQLLIKTNKYLPIEKMVKVRANDTAKVTERLSWSSSSVAGSARSKAARDEIDEGVRVAELLRAPRAVMINADEADGGSGEVSLRLVDAGLKAGHNPVFVRYNASKAEFAEALNRASSIIVKQSRLDVLKDPQKYLDPDGVGEPILLGKGGRPITRKPAFWAVLGGILAAGAGGAAAAMIAGGGGGDGSGAGSLNVQFK